MQTSPSQYIPARGAAPDTWYHADAPRLIGPPVALGERLFVDVAVIGAGFTGLSAALDLAAAGLSVVVLEAGEVGAGASGRNGGLVCSGWRHDQAWFEKNLGQDNASALWQIAEDAKADLVQRAQDLGIEIDWAPGLINLAHAKSMMHWLDEDAELLTQRYGYGDKLTRLKSVEVAQATGTNVYCGGWRDDGAGRIQPLKLLHGLAAAAMKAGAKLFEHTRVTGIGPRGAGRTTLTTATGAEVRAIDVLVCGDAYLDGVCPPVETRVMPIGSFVVATEPLDPALGIMAGAPGGMDTRFVVNYFQKTHDGRLVFGGGEKYTPGWPDDIESFVRGNLARVFPSLRDAGITYAWAGAVGITPQRLPWLREISPGVLVSAGYSGQGVALAPYFGRLLAKAVITRTGFDDVLGKLPVPTFTGGRLLRWPLLTAALNWYALRDRLA
jgi:gamma-glutamylputrescine oxidase